MQRAVLPDDVPADVQLVLETAMIGAEHELVEMALSISASGGAVADAVKKQVYHAHGVDWAVLLTLAEVLRINAAALALLAEREIEQQAVQASLGLS